MRQPFIIFVAIVVGLLLLVVSQSLYILRESQAAVVLQFGDPQRAITQPGLHIKTPFVQNVVVKDDRIQSFDPDAQDLLLSDQQRVAVDYYIQYRIADVVKFFESFGDVQSQTRAEARLESTTDAKIRDALGKAVLEELLSSKRLALVAGVQEQVANEMERFGIEIVDIRIGKADLLDANQEQVFLRMNAERQTQAAELRANGQQEKQNILAETEREVRTIVAEARQTAERLRGEGDRFRINEVDGAYAQAADFAACYLALRSYDNVLGSGAIQLNDVNSSVERGDSLVNLVLTTDNAFFGAFQTGCVEAASR